MLKKDGFQFKNILSKKYILDEDVPVILKKKTMGDGSIRVVYAQYTTTTIKITFGNMSGEDVKDYFNRLVDGTYEYWSRNRMYKTANFMVDKSDIDLINSNNGETWGDFTITLTKTGEA